MARIPALADIGIRKFFCGPESFTSDVHPLLGPAPELDNYFVAAGLNSLGILLGGGVGTVMASWIVDGEPPVDVTGYAIDRTSPHESTRAFRRERTVEQLGVLFGDAVYPSWRPPTARNMRRSVLHDRFVAAGANFNSSVGWEFVEWFEGDAFPHRAEAGTSPVRPSFDLVAERAPHGARGRRDHGHDPDGQVRGAGSRTPPPCCRGCRPTTWTVRSGGWSTPSGSTRGGRDRHRPHGHPTR